MKSKHPYFHDTNDELFLNSRNITLFNHLNTDESPLYITGKDAYSKDAYSIYFFPTPFYTKYSTLSSCRPVSCNQSCNSKPICYNENNLKRSIYFPQYIKSVKHKIYSSGPTNLIQYTSKNNEGSLRYKTPIGNVDAFNYKPKL